jgi:hypothetical protein
VSARIRFVVLTGGANGYPREARAYAVPPRVARYTSGDGREGVISGWPGGTGFGAPVRGAIVDFDGRTGRCSAREVAEADAVHIEQIDAEIEAAKATLARLHRERVEVCEAAAARGKKVRVES